MAPQKNWNRRSPQFQVGAFLHFLMSECGLSENTLAAYRVDVMRFLRWRTNELSDSSAPLKVQDLTDYVAWLHSQNLSPKSIARNLAGLSSFFRFEIFEGRADENLVKLLDAPKLWERLPTVLSPASIDRLMSVPVQGTMSGDRAKAILETLYASGCRVSEVAGLRVQDVDLIDGWVRCIGKGDKQRVVPIGSRGRESVATYLQKWRGVLAARSTSQTDSLFLSNRGLPVRRNTIWKLVKTCSIRAGLPVTVSPHTLRHSFATHLLAGGADLRVVQELLGHSSIATTQIYTKVEVGRLKRVHSECHPRSSAPAPEALPKLPRK